MISDDRILAGVQGFTEAFDFRYIQVVRKAIPKYRPLIVGRINPLIRRFQLNGLNAEDVAERLIRDWATRNFVTAGGFAIEELAIGVSLDTHKSSTAGIDIERFEPKHGAFVLYVLKSGVVTRNSDILAALKSNAKKAERVLRQGKTTKSVTANYAIAAGKTSPTSFDDGVRRPSTQDLWSELTGLDAAAAIELVLAMSMEAGRLVNQDADESMRTMRILVASYIESLDGSGEVDWKWVSKRTMREKGLWTQEDQFRHKRALEALKQAALLDEAKKIEEQPEVDDIEDLTSEDLN